MRPQAFCIYDQSLTTKRNNKKPDYKTPNNELAKLGNIKIITPKCTLSVIRSSMNMLHIIINIKNEYSIKLSPFLEVKQVLAACTAVLWVLPSLKVGHLPEDCHYLSCSKQQQLHFSNKKENHS